MRKESLEIVSNTSCLFSLCRHCRLRHRKNYLQARCRHQLPWSKTFTTETLEKNICFSGCMWPTIPFHAELPARLHVVTFLESNGFKEIDVNCKKSKSFGLIRDLVAECCWLCGAILAALDVSQTPGGRGTYPLHEATKQDSWGKWCCGSILEPSNPRPRNCGLA